MEFAVYSKEGCPYCSKIETVLKLASLNHKVYKLGINFTKEQFYGNFGEGSTFPQIVLNGGKNLGGCTETIRYLTENNIINFSI